ncbi:MAG: ribonuclease P protein component [Campylobacterales bacterium]
MSCLKHTARLKTKDEFSEVYSSRKRFHTKFFVLFYSKKGDLKAGFTASKKVGNAPERNYAKRRLRALYQEYCNKLKAGHFVFVAKKDLLQDNFAEIKKDFEFALKKLELLK